MQAALIMMTILGCDDGLDQCKYVDTAKQRYVSIELCDAASEKVLDGYTTVNFPNVIAVCQKPGQQVATLPGGAVNPQDLRTPSSVKQDLTDLSEEDSSSADGQPAAPAPSTASQPAAATPDANAFPPAPTPDAAAEPPHDHETLAARALETIRLALPGKEKVKMVLTAPLHVITDSYSWVAKKVNKEG